MRIGNGHLSTKKGPLSDFDRGIYKILLYIVKREIIRGEKNHLSHMERALVIKENLHKLKENGHRSDFK